MEMSIDNSIRLLEDYLEWQKLHKMDGTGIDDATNKLIEVAKKYQKIEQIIKFPVYIHEDVLRYKMICEVVEDGND